MKVRVEGLTKIYENIKAVDGLNVSIEDGHLVSILGPSGCGKSTFLYMLAGIVEPTSGEIFFEEEKINDVAIEKRNIGLVFQNYSLYPHMTVMENLIFPLRMMGKKKKEALEKAGEIGKILKIESLLNRKPKELSGGQQQRVAIGRALIKKPKLLLMDEPFSNLDAALRVEMREEIKTLQKNFSITTLFVTHDQEEALSISDKIILMNNGQVVQYCSGQEMYYNPNSIFAANFIGMPKINMLEDLNKIRSLGNRFKDFKSKALGIRPEDILLKTIDHDEKNQLIGNITDIQVLGKETHIKILVNDCILRTIVTGECNYNIGETVEVFLNKIHSFNK